MKVYSFVTGIVLLITFNSYGQVRTVSSTTMLKPVIMMKDYKLTQLFKNRQVQYGANFNPPSKTITYNDGTKLHIQLIKNPSFAGQSNAINASVSHVPVHGQSAPSGYNCSTSTISLSATSTSFMNGDYTLQAQHLYPGAIYTFDNFFNGSYKEETGGRNSINIGTDNPNVTASYVSVNNPDQYTIHNAIASLFGNSIGTAGTGSLVYQMYQSSNSADLNLKITAGGSGYGFSFSNVFNLQNQSKHEYLTIDARKELFTLYTTPPANGFFTDPSRESTSNLMYIGSVTYGIRVLANLDLTFNSQSDADTFKAAYSGYGVTGNVDLNFISNNSSVNSTINAYVVGGPSNSTISFDKSQLQSQMQSILAGATYQNARPISYTLYDMAGDAIGSQSATDQFTTQLCVPANKVISLSGATVSVTCGDDGKDHDTHYSYNLYNSAGNYSAWYQNNNNNSEFQ
ncbi:MAG: thiol-activated cytolysin family protein, partial [Flavisolibacter sp.]